MAILIRWLGAFRHRGASLSESIMYELSRDDEVAAELIADGAASKIYHARVGLLVSSSAVIKTFGGDCWSEYENGRLVKTRNPRRAKATHHREAWVRPQYCGIVVRGKDLHKRITRTLRYASAKYELPVYRLGLDGKLKEIYI